MSSSSIAGKNPPRIAIVLAFLSVYFCWGATYTAMSIGVHLLPATILAGTRMLIGAALMFSFCAIRGKRLIYSRGVMVRLIFVGILLLFGGNIALVWSEKYLASGLSALLVAVVPLYVAVIERLLPGGERLRPRGTIGILLGLCALIALLWPSLYKSAPSLRQGLPMQMFAAGAILLGALSWASGSVLFRRMQLEVDPLVAAGWEMLAAGVCNLTIATATWQWPHAVWNARSIASIGYLVLFGSLLGFSCYIWLIHHVPVAKVATYAFVNPVVAVILGTLILGEQLQPSEYVGMVMVICAVALVISSQTKSGKSAAEIEVEPLENEA
ncbi:MAG: EamA family transporter [Acidobacteriota bacterium]|nr:EamA family transporter [Acidobacteriota bacterium]